MSSPASPEPPVPMPAGACCEECEASSQGSCALCKKAICRHCRSFVNGKQCCAVCTAQIKKELAAEKGDLANMPMAIALGLGAALISGAVWAAIAVAIKLQVGYVAVGVGWLAGQGVYYGSGKKRGLPLQLLASGCALLGLLLGKYFFVAAVVRDIAAKNGTDIGYFDPNMVQAFFSVFTQVLSPFDILWIFLALGMAWSIPKPSEIRVR